MHNNKILRHWRNIQENVEIIIYKTNLILILRISGRGEGMAMPDKGKSKSGSTKKNTKKNDKKSDNKKK